MPVTLTSVTVSQAEMTAKYTPLILACIDEIRLYISEYWFGVIAETAKTLQFKRNINLYF